MFGYKGIVEGSDFLTMFLFNIEYFFKLKILD